MSYINYVDHPKWGQVWYRMTLRNWCCLDKTAEENRRMGPLCEIDGTKYMVSACGRDPTEATERFNRTLDWWGEVDKELPLHSEHPAPANWPWRRFHWWLLNRRWRKSGQMCPVEAPE